MGFSKKQNNVKICDKCLQCKRIHSIIVVTKEIKKLMSNLVIGIIVGLWIGFGTVASLSGLALNNMLFSGIVAGALCGNVQAGFEVGAQCLLMNLGFYTYGGATIPDYTVGAAFGAALVAKGQTFDAGILVATGIATLMSEMDILGRATTTAFQHLAEGSLAKNSISGFEFWTIMGLTPWTLTRAIPVAIGFVLLDKIAILTEFATSIQWIANGLAIVGGALPAVGFALLISYMDIKKYWPFLIIGYACYAFLGANTICLALIGLALGALFMNVIEGGAQ